MSGSLILVTFAVAEEARPFRTRLAPDSPVEILLTGIGAARTHAVLLPRLKSLAPQLVISAGFAGGLDPALRTGDVLCDSSRAASLAPRLQRTTARPARFHCSPTVLISPEAKSRAREITGADAVEMESGPIQQLCRERRIPCAVVRVISDRADEQLPFDFNACMRPDGRVRPLALLGECLLHPTRLAGLLRLRNTTRLAAERLAEVLVQITRP